MKFIWFCIFLYYNDYNLNINSFILNFFWQRWTFLRKFLKFKWLNKVWAAWIWRWKSLSEDTAHTDQLEVVRKGLIMYHDLAVFFTNLGATRVKAVHKMLMKLTPAFNFINILHTNFSYECYFSSFFYVHVTRKSCPNDVCTKNANF